ncbi:ROK family protein [Nocardia implantans]|uniref:ROK family protein n=1 Tax=Nocardia implantans TaxID=3108168 RepID=A0ABU6ANS6_9NOCA|nr:MULTISPECIES: ROK family protein [unclassified Nocardia]MBF6192287.1 ROK family protein [Nocardia beijingensis]MEA3531039.1 ROK family protein [Nocardia sp. CDC192]MEB3509129.1 ROK family protein [Nocardia sp. CDC186]
MSLPTLERSVSRVAGSRTRVQRPVVAPELRIGDNPAAAVLRAATGGPVSRDNAARTTGLSIATVNRQVSALLAAGLLRERPDLTASGAVGRPRVPFEIDHEAYLTIGIHIGAAVTKIVAADLRGRILGGLAIATPQTGQEFATVTVARSAKAFLQRWHRRKALWAGVAIGGRVDPLTGVVDHPKLEWRGAQVGSVLGEVLELPVSVAPHVEAMAGSELLLPTVEPKDQARVERGSSLYFYVRETAGIAVTLDGRVHTPSNGPGSIAHLPTGSDVECACGRRGCLEVTVGDRSLHSRAVGRGIIPAHNGTAGSTIADLYRAAEAGSESARELLAERATILGHTVAMVRDMLNPDRVILGGQAFTGYRPAVAHVARAFNQGSTLPPTDIRISGFGGKVQEYAAVVTSLSVLYADPLAAIRRTAAID